MPEEVLSAAPDLADDFSEAVAVLPMSRKASAALSRRCLQFILREKAGAKKRDLADQIEEVLPSLPSHLARDLDAVRNIGNFSAHPMKSQSTGAIADVEDGEAEWSLDALEALIDFYYVAPLKSDARLAALNAKLADLGKARVKGS